MNRKYAHLGKYHDGPGEYLISLSVSLERRLERDITVGILRKVAEQLLAEKEVQYVRSALKSFTFERLGEFLEFLSKRGNNERLALTAYSGDSDEKPVLVETPKK